MAWKAEVLSFGADPGLLQELGQHPPVGEPDPDVSRAES